MRTFQNIEYIQQLIAKHLREESTSNEEDADLHDWCEASPLNKEKFEQITDVAFLKQLQVDNQFSNDRERLWQKINQQTAKRSTIVRFRIAKVAAVLLVLISAIVVWLLIQRNGKSRARQVVQQSNVPSAITPGTSFKAKLTLSDGTSILLDTSTSEKLAKQGNSVILNRNGQLIYKQQQAGGAVLYNTLSTSNGQTYKALLSDGSVVYLNSASSLRYPVAFTGNERKVEITGEAYFEIAKDKEHPFRVVSDNLQVEVLGTKFNVNAYEDEDEISTTLIEGSIKITSRESKSPVILKPQQQAQVKEQSNKVSIFNEVDTEAITGWVQGRFIFNDTNIESVMRQIARWYDVQVKYGYDSKKRPLNINGEISRYSNVTRVLDIMKSTGWLDFKVDGKTITVIAK
jgi:transmembrane sensor